MELRDWLTAVAMRNGSTPSGAKHYHGFAAQIRKEFPRFPLSDATAHAVGGELGGQFPTWPELAAAIRAILAEAATGNPGTEEDKIADAWVRFFHRRIREAPHLRDHLLSLLRANSRTAFLQVDDGHDARASDAFSAAFWAERGGRKHYDPGDFIPDATGQRMPMRFPKSAAPKTAAQDRPKPMHHDPAALLARYEADAAKGNPAAATRAARLRQAIA